ncbi:unnamed protein product [Thlaspi arvense]|uniref:Uncharacterized protein n=1 Tax=Thlaspi arvense TaxID=13288 RepID=A0AAU9T452_THLAR|nr:unnamed protein product [Thlaspi arvense]
MAQNDRNTRIAAFEMVDKWFGKSHKISPKPHVVRDDFPSSFNQNSYEYGGPKSLFRYEGPKSYTVNCTYQYHPTDGIQHYSGARPLIDHANRFEKQKERAITCDEAFLRYGGVLIKTFRN